jgi:hypothetical protein
MLDPNNFEAGWMQLVSLRLIETNIGYTSTALGLRAACKESWRLTHVQRAE